MKTTLNTSSKLNLKEHNKDKYFQGQMKRVFSSFHSHPKTMLMVSIETGILRANLCRYVAFWRKQNRIAVVQKGICPISKSTGVQFLTTNPDLFPFVEPTNTDVI